VTQIVISKPILTKVAFLGGGMAMADAAVASGLTHVVGENLVQLKQYLPPLLTVLVVCIATLMLTELTSSVAVANFILPVLAEMVGDAFYSFFTFLSLTFWCCKEQVLRWTHICRPLVNQYQRPN